MNQKRRASKSLCSVLSLVQCKVLIRDSAAYINVVSYLSDGSNLSSSVRHGDLICCCNKMSWIVWWWFSKEIRLKQFRGGNLLRRLRKVNERHDRLRQIGENSVKLGVRLLFCFTREDCIRKANHTTNWYKLLRCRTRTRARTNSSMLFILVKRTVGGGPFWHAEEMNSYIDDTDSW